MIQTHKITLNDTPVAAETKNFVTRKQKRERETLQNFPTRVSSYPARTIKSKDLNPECIERSFFVGERATIIRSRFIHAFVLIVTRLEKRRLLKGSGQYKSRARLIQLGE